MGCEPKEKEAISKHQRMFLLSRGPAWYEAGHGSNIMHARSPRAHSWCNWCGQSSWFQDYIWRTSSNVLLRGHTNTWWNTTSAKTLIHIFSLWKEMAGITHFRLFEKLFAFSWDLLRISSFQSHIKKILVSFKCSSSNSIHVFLLPEVRLALFQGCLSTS